MLLSLGQPMALKAVFGAYFTCLCSQSFYGGSHVAEPIVVLKNASSVLPLSQGKTKTVTGPNAKIANFTGSRSAFVLPYYSACVAHKMSPTLGPCMRDPPGKPGIIFRTLSRTTIHPQSRVVDEVEPDDYSYSHLVVHGKLVFYPDVIGHNTSENHVYEFGLAV
ncbi:hypothetical protein V1504DRAFT_500673 [Lipomyces starkeyi]